MKNEQVKWIEKKGKKFLKINEAGIFL